MRFFYYRVSVYDGMLNFIMSIRSLNRNRLTCFERLELLESTSYLKNKRRTY